MARETKAQLQARVAADNAAARRVRVGAVKDDTILQTTWRNDGLKPGVVSPEGWEHYRIWDAEKQIYSTWSSAVVARAFKV